MKHYTRLIAFLAFVLAGFVYLSVVLFNLQVVHGEDFLEGLDVRMERTVIIPSERGNIYDRLGRPLAVNETIFSLMHDPSVDLTHLELNTILINTIRVLSYNDEYPVYNLPITIETPREFTFFGNFADSQRHRFFLDVNVIDSGENPYEVIQILKNSFHINEEFEEKFSLTEDEKMKLISLRADILRHRYTRYSPVLIASNISEETIAITNEDAVTFASMFINTSQTRHYLGGRYVSHIIGFIERMNENDILAEGRLPTDLIGRSGIERSFEEQLRGVHGREVIYTNRLGRRIGYREGSFVPPVRGSDIFLTIDLEFQRDIYYYIKDTLTRTIIQRLRMPHTEQFRLTPTELLVSLSRAGNINPLKLMEAPLGSASNTVWNFVVEEVLRAYEENEDEDVVLVSFPNPNIRDGRVLIANTIANGLYRNYITPMQILNVLYEQEIISTFSGPNLTEIVIGRLNAGEITPQMSNVDPSTGSVVVVNPNSGEVIAAVSYPSFDNNAFVNDRDNSYIMRLFEDPSRAMYNRAFHERLAPGSTFKMITGLAGLGEGIIAPNTRMMDRVVFTRAGYPYPRSWSSRSLGYINYAEAVALSSNYFFYDVSHRLGIETLNKYMVAFGLDRPTGVEISEAVPHMSSPALHEVMQTTAWNPGYTVRTGIGQHLNGYSAATMARATAIIASRGNATDLRLLNKIVSEDYVYVARTYPIPMNVDISEEAWDATHLGMLLAITHPRGTARGVFANFPIQVGVKTGTAQQTRARMSHTTFNAFAPLDDPQIALYVLMPFSDSSPAPAAQVARDVILNYFGFNSYEYIEETNFIQTTLRP